MTMPKISAVINTRNEERNLRECLETVQWCDEIVVVDMESEDRTVEIAREYTDRVFTHKKILAFDAARNFAVGKATGDWILLVDADEMVPKALADRLLDVAAGDDADVVEILFRHYIMGDWVRHSGWGLTPLPRFFRRGKVLFGETVHDYIHKDPAARTLRLDSSPGHCIHHFSYEDSSRFVEKMNRYSSIEAARLLGNGIRYSVPRLLVASLREFAGRFLKGKGYKDGPRGFSLCLMMAFYRALSHIKLWELETFSEDPVARKYESMRRGILDPWKKNPPSSSRGDTPPR
ncbi:MAG: glycosyltransferase family 2 protein [bacterium]